ncbi:MAG: hypothetical protein FWG53_02395, partial [Clostridiales bacterium]|nr:hypothetical protein [Clostridiales bacterium]
MSMLHKAFCFNTGSFRDELYPIIMKAAADGEISGIIAFIEGNIDSISSPYTEDPIEKDWISELEEVDFQSLADFALTRYYDICEDIGLEYSWAALSEYLTVAEMKHDASYYVLGESV